MTPFRPVADGYAAYWEEVERAVLAQVAREVAEFLRAQAGLPARGATAHDVGPETDGSTHGMLDALDPAVQSTGVPRVPDDPAARRLLPDASRDDDAVAAEFRHLTQTDLAAAKVRGLERFAVVVGEGASGDDPAGPGAGDDAGDDAGDAAVVLVTRPDARDVAAALTDIRLVLAQRLDLTTDDEVEALHDELLGGDFDDDTAQDVASRRYWGGVFVAAGFAQESLVSAMLDDYREHRGANDRG